MASALHLLARFKSFDACTEVSADCPVEATVLGYIPNLGSSVFFSIGFGLLLLTSLTLGIWKRTWTYCVALSLGLLLECLGTSWTPPFFSTHSYTNTNNDIICDDLQTLISCALKTNIGYVGRGIMYNNVWDKSGFQLQICCIIIAPTLICAAIYLTLKHIALALNPSLSRMAPHLYPRVFLPADLTCLIVQAIGGGVAAAAPRNKPKIAQTGNRTIIAGVALQVVVLLAFGVMGTDYYLRVKKYMRSPEADPARLAVWNNRKFRIFGTSVAIAYSSILLRCIYRIAEMAGGWGNHIMQDQPSFLVLDSSLVLITGSLLSIVHPGLFFPQMANGGQHDNLVTDSEKEKSGESSSEGVKSESV
ncbi:RTA1 like protein-domain-containing protein [Mariannaea sp. PMI_226]|nr:RTA1 like protein-domain-containing protein [Mariannaea sp. PMI_226]